MLMSDDKATRYQEIYSRYLAAKEETRQALERELMGHSRAASPNGSTPKFTHLQASRVGLASLAGAKSNMAIGSMSLAPKTNQDYALVTHPVGGNRNSLLVGVYDGHGPYGEAISKSLALSIAQDLDTSLKDVQEPAKVEAALHESSGRGERWIRDNLSRTGSESGATLLTMLLIADTLYVSHVGDTRLALISGADVPPATPTAQASTTSAPLSREASAASDASTGATPAEAPASTASWSISMCTVDHSPNDPHEQKRLAKAGAVVFRVNKSDGTAIHRVRYPTVTEIKARGKIAGAATKFAGAPLASLAMSRSIGDWQFDAIGVSSLATTQRYTLPPDARCLVLATDGLWDQLSGAEVSATCYAHRHNAQQAARTLVLWAAQRWRVRSGIYRDDISVVVLLLPVQGSSGPRGAPQSAQPEPLTPEQYREFAITWRTLEGLSRKHEAARSPAKAPSAVKPLAAAATDEVDPLAEVSVMYTHPMDT